MVQDGQLDLDAPVQRYVPGFPVKRYPITVRQVAGHLAGIRHYASGRVREPGALCDGDRGTRDLRRGLAPVRAGRAVQLLELRLQSPGSRDRGRLRAALPPVHAGCGSGARGHDPYLVRALRQHHPPSRPVLRAKPVPGPIINAPYVDNAYKWPSGGYLSTAEDLARFGERLLRGELLRPETVALLWTSMHTTDGKPTEYGIGWSVERDSTGRRRVRHSGGSVGGTAHLIIYPDARLVVAVLVNSDYTFINAIPRYAEPFLPCRARRSGSAGGHHANRERSEAELVRGFVVTVVDHHRPRARVTLGGHILLKVVIRHARDDRQGRRGEDKPRMVLALDAGDDLALMDKSDLHPDCLSRGEHQAVGHVGAVHEERWRRRGCGPPRGRSRRRRRRRTRSRSGGWQARGRRIESSQRLREEVCKDQVSWPSRSAMRKARGIPGLMKPEARSSGYFVSSTFSRSRSRLGPARASRTVAPRSTSA